MDSCHDLDEFDNPGFMVDLLCGHRQKRKDLIREELIGEKEEIIIEEILTDLNLIPSPSHHDSQSNKRRKTNPITTTTTTTTTEENNNHNRSTRKGKKPNVKRDHEGGSRLLNEHFFNEDCLYPNESDFIQVFKMSKKLFLKIVKDVSEKDIHFTQRKDALGVPGHSSIQKVLAALRQLYYGIGNHSELEEYIRMADSTALESLIRFCKVMNEIYGEEYLRKPNESDLKRINEINSKRGFPGMLGTLDFEYWEWDHCPTGWSGRFNQHSNLIKNNHHHNNLNENNEDDDDTKKKNKKKNKPMLIMEIISTYDLWIWSCFIFTPGNCKDLDIFQSHSKLFNFNPSNQFIENQTETIVPRQQEEEQAQQEEVEVKVEEDLIPKIQTTIDGNQDQKAYYLTNHLYSSFNTLKSTKTQNNNNVNNDHVFYEKFKQISLKSFKRYLNCLKDCKKTLKRLNSNFKILRLPCRLWSSNIMLEVIKTVIVLNNLFVDDHNNNNNNNNSNNNHDFNDDDDDFNSILIDHSNDINVLINDLNIQEFNNLMMDEFNDIDYNQFLPDLVIQKINSRFF